MKKIIICLVLLIFVNVIESAKPKPSVKCNESHRQRIDKMFASVVPALNGVKLPENEKQLQKYCSAVTIAMDSATGYLKTCGGTFGPLMSKMALSEYNKEMNSICKSKDSRKVKELLSAGRCVNSVSAKLEKCGQYMIDSMMALKDVVIENRMNTGCCQSHKLISCTMRSIIKSKRCDKDMIERLEREVLLGVGDICGPYFGDTNKCNQLLNKVPKLNNTYVRPKSIFIPMMAVMDSYRNMKCNAKNEQRMDTMLAQMLTIGTPEQIPENSLQLKQWCTKAAQIGPYFYGYIESCVSDFGKMLSKMVAGVAVNNFDPYCGKQGVLDNPSSQMQEYIKAAKCGNKAEDKIKVCFDKFNENILSISEAPEMSRIKMACCNAYDFRSCIFNATTTTKGCSQQTVQWAERAVMDNIEGVVDMVCADHWGGPKCDVLMQKLPKLDKSKYIPPKSPFFPMIKMLDSFPDVDLQKK